MTHEDAVRRAVELIGARGAVAMLAVVTLDDAGAVTISREYHVGYSALDEQRVARCVALGRGSTWEAAFSAAAPFMTKERCSRDDDEESRAAARDGARRERDR